METKEKFFFPKRTNHWKSKYQAEKDTKLQAILSDSKTKFCKISRSQIRKCQRSKMDRFPLYTFLKYFQKIFYFKLDVNKKINTFSFGPVKKFAVGKRRRGKCQSSKYKVWKYSSCYKKFTYRARLGNAFTTGIGATLQYFNETVHSSTLRYVAHPSNIARMAYKLSILAYLQVGEMLYQCDSVTLAHDATAVVDKHPDFQISVRLPDGTAVDYTVTLFHLYSKYGNCSSLSLIVIL
ncbi:hypothetical protein HELRODRAFT_161034 [Helobdella robusta]|uniref:Uncharacterized protein n=1 Tax=Helobdella robusta TaxID=6412 RepID=T1ER13_HELRO|nr:hypothetical protein HELRODRAFT_161034 [Helobdella robusta]ESO01855.1 hypothetical protein HELRODRAFT_161034 [Helobdella robusta]